MATAMTTTRPEQTLKVERLDLEGMTCASCAARIEKKLNRLDGVEATVNFATEQSTVHGDTSPRSSPPATAHTRPGRPTKRAPTISRADISTMTSRCACSPAG